MGNMGNYEIDGLLVKTKRIFPILYREAMFLGAEDMSVEQFTRAYVKRLKKADLSVFQSDENLVTLPETLSIWITMEGMLEARRKVTEYIWSQDQVRLIYILKMEVVPFWGCVQIPNSQLELLKAQRRQTDVRK